jgi:hypothetical protein
MPAIGAIADQEVDKLHNPVFGLTKRELEKLILGELPASLVDDMKAFTRAVLELKGAKDVPLPGKLTDGARVNIASKQRAADEAYDAVAAQARNLNPDATHQIGQVMKFYAREIDRAAGSVMENTGRFY